MAPLLLLSSAQISMYTNSCTKVYRLLSLLYQGYNISHIIINPNPIKQSSSMHEILKWLQTWPQTGAKLVDAGGCPAEMPNQNVLL